MGKWTKITATLPRYREEDQDPGHREKKDAVKVEILKPICAEDEEFLDYDSILDGFIAGTRQELERALYALTRGVACEQGLHPHASAYAPVWGRLHDLKEFVAECEKKVNLLRGAYLQLMDEQYEREDITNIKTTEGSSVRLEIAPRLVVKDSEAYRQWCIAQGFETKMTLPWNTANADLKERLEHGEDVPPGCEAWSQVKAVYTPSKD